MRSSKEGWKTIEVIQIAGDLYAYQQRYVLVSETEREKKTMNNYGGDDTVGYGVGHSVTKIEEEKHRLQPVKETLDSDSIELVVRNNPELLNR